MSEAAEITTKAKPPREERIVKMSDNRSVTFVGKRKLLKETLIDESKITVEGKIIKLHEGAVAIRLDFVNGETRTWTPPLSTAPSRSVRRAPPLVGR